jgi:hypothetical protein
LLKASSKVKIPDIELIEETTLNSIQTQIIGYRIAESDDQSAKITDIKLLKASTKHNNYT